CPGRLEDSSEVDAQSRTTMGSRLGLPEQQELLAAARSSLGGRLNDSHTRTLRSVLRPVPSRTGPGYSSFWRRRSAGRSAVLLPARLLWYSNDRADTCWALPVSGFD